jgi:16S rRNA (cytosine967-C5)-methyltransferase
MSNRRNRPRGAVRPTPALNARVAAVQAVVQVLQQRRSLSEALPAALAALDEGRALAQELAYGVLRWHGRLSALGEQLLDKPLRARDADIRTVLETGLYQLAPGGDVPAQWVVSECVDATRLLNKDWAAGMLNAVLRRYIRERDVLDASVDTEPDARLSHPAWLLERLQADWPEQWSAIAEANNQRPPMTLRVNTRQVSVDAYRRLLDDAGMTAAPHEHVAGALTLERPVAVDRLPGFAEGRVSVQDAGAQMAAWLLEAQPGDRVLDACAAPGGKTGHILELQPELGALVAVDSEPGRLRRVEENLDRLGGRAELHAADAADVDAWWDGRPFQRILLDAPCTGTGVIRRHPDIKWLRRRGDAEALAADQSRLLAALWPLLAPGGKLIYCTCSVMPAENDAVLGPFLQATADARMALEGAPWGVGLRHGRQILPGQHGMDGFYYGGLVKTR